MNFLNSIIPDEYIQAIGWTLLHSIWQGGIIAFLAAILLIVLQGSSNTRYLVSAGAMKLILITSIITFSISLKSEKEHKNLPVSVYSEATEPIEREGLHSLPMVATEGNPDPTNQSIISQYKAYFSAHFPLIITIWFGGILLLTLKFLGGLAYVQRLKHYKAVDITHQWQGNLRYISQRIGLEKAVRILESSIITVPMVVGYFKPVILLPVGAVTGLSPSQIEAILAHELAHILRKDYLINLIQTLVEIIFFYHPAVWWLSARVREEREHCCDDIAVRVNENTLVYAKALTALGEMQVQTPPMAMAATGTSGTLFKRIKRMLTKPTQNPTFSEGFITACALFVCIFSFTLIARADFKSHDGPDIITSVSDYEEMDSAEDVLDAVALNIQNAAGEDDNLIIIKNKKGKIIELYVNGKKIPQSEIPNYTAIIDEKLAGNEEQPEQSPFAASDDAALRNTIEEPIEVEKPEEPENSNAVKRPHNFENFSFHSKKHPQDTASRIMESFAQKAMEIAKLGLKMGSLEIDKERLQRKLAAKEDESNTRSEISRIEKEIKKIEAKIGKLEKELEASGEQFGKLSLDIASSILDSIQFNFKYNSNDDDE